MVGFWGSSKKKSKKSSADDELSDDSDTDTSNLSLSDRQTWTVVFGPIKVVTHETTATTTAERKSSVHVEAGGDKAKGGGWKMKLLQEERTFSVEKVDRVDLEEDRTLLKLFTKIEAATETRLLPPSHYVLQYSLPSSPLAINVHMGDHGQVMAAYEKFGRVGKKGFRRLKFRIMPRVKGTESEWGACCCLVLKLFFFCFSLFYPFILLTLLFFSPQCTATTRRRPSLSGSTTATTSTGTSPMTS